ELPAGGRFQEPDPEPALRHGEELAVRGEGERDDLRARAETYRPQASDRPLRQGVAVTIDGRPVRLPSFSRGGRLARQGWRQAQGQAEGQGGTEQSLEHGPLR